MRNLKIYCLLLLMLFGSVACSGTKGKYDSSENVNAVRDNNFKVEDHYPVPDVGIAAAKEQIDKADETFLVPPKV